MKENQFAKVVESGSKIKPLSGQIAYGPGSWDRKIDAIAPVIKAFYEDVRDVYWDDQVADFFMWKLKRFREAMVEAHIVQQVQSAREETEVVKAMVDDLRMRKVIGLL